MALTAAGYMACASEAPSELNLAQKGKSDYVIVEGAAPIPAEKNAAAELSRYLEKVTGASFPIVSEGKAAKDQCAIYIGSTDYASRQGIKPDSLDDEEWVIRSVGKNLILTGGRPRGTLYAVYEFLEQQVGCHWLDELTEVVQNKPDLSIKALSVRGKPVFQLRDLWTGTPDSMPTQLLRARNKDTRVFSAELGFLENTPGHTFYNYSRRFPSDHPEYHAMDNKGERPPAISLNGPGQICLTNPEVRKLMVRLLDNDIADKNREFAADIAKGRKPRRFYYIAPNDVGFSCQCPTCKAFKEREGTDSALMVDFVNAIADEIKKKYPDVLIGTFAYENNLMPPKNIRPHDNVIICLAQLNAEWGKGEEYPDLFRPMNSPVNRKAKEILEQWAKISKHVEVWDYWVQCINDKFSFPYTFLHCLSPDLKLFRDCKVERIFSECETEKPRTSFHALTCWLGRKLMQNPDQDPAPLIQTFMTGYYGPAAGKMTEYLNYMQKRIEAVPEKDGKLCRMFISDRPCLDFAFFKTAEDLLDEAEKSCPPGSLYLLNVRQERIQVDSGLYCLWEKLEKQLPAGQKMPWKAADILQRYKENRLAQIKARPYMNPKNPAAETVVEKEVTRMKGFHAVRGGKRPPVTTVPKQASAAIPGNPSSIDWSKAAPLNQWFTLEGNKLPERKILGKTVQDGKYLYLLLEETNLDLSKLSPQWWVGDGWELFFSSRRSGFPYRQLAVNSEGKFYAFSYENGPASQKTWQSGAVVRAEKKDGCWRTWIALPLSGLMSKEEIDKGSPVFLNIFRTIRLSQGSIMCLSPIYEASYHDMMRLAEWIPETDWPQKEENLALGKSYQFSRKPNMKHCLSKDPERELKKLTDGIFSGIREPIWFDSKNTVGFFEATRKGRVEITFDLEQTATVEKVLVHTAAGANGIEFPDSIQVLTGMDGIHFTPVGELAPVKTENAGYRVSSLIIPLKETNARYVRLVFLFSNYWMNCDEVAITGKWK